MLYPELGVIENDCELPELTETAPEGLMEPFDPAEAVMVYEFARQIDPFHVLPEAQLEVPFVESRRGPPAEPL